MSFYIRYLLLLIALVPAVAPEAAGAAGMASPAVQWKLLLSRPAVSLPRALAIDQRGNPTANKWLYATDSASQRVVKFGSGGKMLGSWQYGETSRRGNAATIAVGPDGAVFVANPVDNKVSKYSPSGALLARWGGFGGLRDIAIDQTGNIYVAENQPHRVTELSPTGNMIQRWDTRTLWNGRSAGNPLHLAVASASSQPSAIDTVYVLTRCIHSYTCSRRVEYLSGSGYVTHLLLPLRANGLFGDERGLVGIALPGGGQPAPRRDSCNNRFMALDSMAGAPNGQLYVAGLLWPRNAAQPSFGLGLGPGLQGCTHDGIGLSWTTWPLPIDDSVRGMSLLGHHQVHGLAVDGRGDIFVSQGDRIWELPAG